MQISMPVWIMKQCHTTPVSLHNATAKRPPSLVILSFSLGVFSALMHGPTFVYCSDRWAVSQHYKRKDKRYNSPDLYGSLLHFENDTVCNDIDCDIISPVSQQNYLFLLSSIKHKEAVFLPGSSCGDSSFNCTDDQHDIISIINNIEICTENYFMWQVSYCSFFFFLLCELNSTASPKLQNLMPTSL